MKRIGVFGGTFNPIHIGHLAVAQTAQEAMRLDKVIFVPSNWPPHKNSDTIAAARHRFNMVRLAIKGNSFFAISDFEIKRPGKSYTIDTLKYLRRIFPKGAKIFFIIGGDTLPHLKEWKYIDGILKMANFVVVNRPGQFRKNRGKRIRYYSVSMSGIDISSSNIRSRIAQSRATKYYVPDNVLSYIRKHRLYKTK